MIRQCLRCQNPFEIAPSRTRRFCSKSCAMLWRTPPPAELVHGTLNGYTFHKCRCDDCRAINREYQRKWRKSGALGTPQDFEERLL